MAGACVDRRRLVWLALVGLAVMALVLPAVAAAASPGTRTKVAAKPGRTAAVATDTPVGVRTLRVTTTSSAARSARASLRFDAGGLPQPYSLPTRLSGARRPRLLARRAVRRATREALAPVPAGTSAACCCMNG